MIQTRRAKDGCFAARTARHGGTLNGASIPPAHHCSKRATPNCAAATAAVAILRHDASTSAVENGIMGLDMSKMAAEQQKKMADTQAKMVARQLEMQLQMRERMIAMQVAQARDLVKFYAAFLAVAAPAMLLRVRATGNKAWAAPLLPLSFVFAYQYDFAYYTKMERILTEADRILVAERGFMRVPGAALSLEYLDTCSHARELAAPQEAPPPLQ